MGDYVSEVTGDRAIRWPAHPVPLGAVRVGSDGRFGLQLLECAHCQAPLVAPRTPLGEERALRVVLTLSEHDYPLAVLEPADSLRAHVTASPGCRRAYLGFRAGERRLPLRWERGLIAHVMEP